MRSATKNKTSIEWTWIPGTTGATWNPVTGCTKVSPGCDHCYAETLTHRYKWNGGRFDEIITHPDRLGWPSKLRGPHTVFVCSMSDLFHRDVPESFLGEVWDRMVLNPQHTFLLLTKRPGRMAAWALGHDWPSNIWAGTSVESQKYVPRIGPLSLVPAPVRFLSVEPMIEAVDLMGYTDAIDWVITGGESGPGWRPFAPEWADEIRRHCEMLEIPYFHKQNGGLTPKSGGDELFGVQYKAFPIPR